jgi:hypothetical protein
MTQFTNTLEGKFPRSKLVVWPFVPLSIAAFVYLAEVSGHGVTNHGSVYFFLFVIFASAVAAFIFSLFILPAAIRRLKSNPVDRTSVNYLSVGFSIAFDLAFLAGAFVFFRFA